MWPFLRLSTGVDWCHRHLVSKYKYPEIYSVYFTGPYSLDYSTVRHSPLHYRPVCQVGRTIDKAELIDRRIHYTYMELFDGYNQALQSGAKKHETPT